jgi:uncharacterized protein (DUF1501 family)
MRISRRSFLEALGAVGIAASFSRLGEGRAFAQTAADYKALVCVFLFGGNDGNNTVVPLDSAGYAAYATARGAIGAGGLALPQAQLLPLAPASGTAAYGLHPNLPELQTLWNDGVLGVVFNVGTLLAPTTKQQFLQSSVPVPISLLSHQDQQHQWQTSLSDQYSRTGWGGRIADGLGAGPLPAVISISGNQLFTVGASTSPLSLPAAGGGFGLAGFDGSAASNARLQAMTDVRTLQEQNLIVQATQAEATAALSASKLVAPVLAGTSSTVDSLFAGLTSSIALQLKQVARMIAARQTLGVGRQIFFVSQSSYDTHNDQLNRQGTLFGDLSPALKAFYQATVQLGVSQQVTSFTLSDFGRTLQPASGDGSDHAWGSHHLVLGGAVKGQQTYGTFPTLQLGGPDDFTSQGRWVPTTAVDQYAATLATWFGVSAADLPTVLPYVGRYATANLGFLG